MGEVARITTDGELKLAGGVDSRLPTITDGLISHFPFDNTDKGINTGDIFSYDGDFPNLDFTPDKIGEFDTFYMETEIYLNSYPSERYSFLWAGGPATNGTSNMYLSVDSSGKVSVYEYAKVSNGYHASNQKLELNTWYTVAHLSTPDKTYILINGKIDREINNAQEYLPDINVVSREGGGRELDGISRNPRISSFNPIPTTSSNISLDFDGLRVEESTANIVPNAEINGYPTYGNGWGTYNTNQYNSNTTFNIGTVSSITDDIVTLSSIDHPIYTYDVLHSHTSGGGITANTQYFIKKHSENSFSLHAYNGSQDGSQGYSVDGKGFKVHESMWNGERIPITLSGFPTDWHGHPHKPNSALVKEIIPLGFKGLSDCIRCHGEHKPEGGQDYLAYGVNPSVTAGETYIISFWVRAVNAKMIGSTLGFNLYTGASWSESLIMGNNTFEDFKWHRLIYRGVAPNSGGTNFYIPFQKEGCFDISQIMFESGAIPHAFTTSSRGDGTFIIDSNLNSEGTISFDYKTNDRISNTVISNASYNYWWGLYQNSTEFLYMHEGHDGSSLSPNNYKCPLNEWTHLTIKWDSVSQSFYESGNLLGTVSTVGSVNASNIPAIYLGYGWNRGNAWFKNLSIYDRALDDNEILENSRKDFKLTQAGDTRHSVDADSISGWTKVYEGVATHMTHPEATEYEQLDLYGDEYEFDQMMIVHKHAPHLRRITNTSRTAKLKYSIKWYFQWVDQQPDANSPRLKVHGLDDVQDVTFDNYTIWGYGNSWRRIGSYLYIAGTAPSAYLYMGATPAEVVKTDWFTYYGDDNYFTNEDSMDFRESGINKLTPREYQTLQVFIRKNTDEEPKLNIDEGVLKMQEGISTGEVL